MHNLKRHERSGKTWSVCVKCGLTGPDHTQDLDEGLWKTECVDLPPILPEVGPHTHLSLSGLHASIFIAILRERGFQLRKWGDQRHDNGTWGLIAMEELGEAADAALCENKVQLINELVQTAAVIVAWLEDLTREEA